MKIVKIENGALQGEELSCLKESQVLLLSFSCGVFCSAPMEFQQVLLYFKNDDGPLRNGPCEVVAS